VMVPQSQHHLFAPAIHIHAGNPGYKIDVKAVNLTQRLQEIIFIHGVTVRSEKNPATSDRGGIFG